MTFPLPLRNFKWLTEEELKDFDPQQDITDKNGQGYILEVDLEYPKELHLQHNSYPLAAESMEITQTDLSSYAKDCLKGVYGKSKHKAKKLTSTLRDRKKYVLHGMNLKLYLALGMRLLKIHRGISFYQEDFIKPYIEMCTKKRKAAPTESLKNMYKVIKNKIFLGIRYHVF